MTIGIRPSQGFALPDCEWLRQLSNGNNFTFQSGITAHAGGGQANALLLSGTLLIQEVDTVASGNDSVMLPFAAAGKAMVVFNKAASNSMNLYANVGTNPLTASTDTINNSTNSTAYAITAGQAVLFVCAKNGAWAAIKSA
jgi:hypothetical protein